MEDLNPQQLALFEKYKNDKFDFVSLFKYKATYQKIVKDTEITCVIKIYYRSTLSPQVELDHLVTLESEEVLILKEETK